MIDTDSSTQRSLFVLTVMIPLLILTIPGCAFGPAGGPSEQNVKDPYEPSFSPENEVTRQQLFTPLPEQDTGPLRIQQGDVLSVRLSGEEIGPQAWGGEFTVPTDGRLDFMFAGSVKVAGKTRHEVKQILVDRLRPDYFRDPQLSVNFVSLSQIDVRAMGAIGRPRKLSLSRDSTIMDALVQAGNLTRHSVRIRMFLFRNDEGDTSIYFSNYEKYVQGDFRHDLALQDGDVLYVQTRFWPHFDTLTDVLQTLGFVATSVDAIRDVSEGET